MSNKYSEQGFKHVFVALDGHAKQTKVLEQAMAIASLHHAKLTIGHVIDATSLSTAGVYVPDVIEGLKENFHESIEEYVEEARKDEDIPSVEVVVKVGCIRETLLEDMIEVYHPDLVICGARGLSATKYALLGSVSTFLLRNTPTDILVVK